MTISFGPGFLARQQRRLVRQSFRREEMLKHREPMMVVVVRPSSGSPRGAMSDDSSTIEAALILGRSGTGTFATRLNVPTGEPRQVRYGRKETLLRPCM
jgi:hypothetical protein